MVLSRVAEYGPKGISGKVRTMPTKTNLYEQTYTCRTHWATNDVFSYFVNSRCQKKPQRNSSKHYWKMPVVSITALFILLSNLSYYNKKSYPQIECEQETMETKKNGSFSSLGCVCRSESWKS